MKKNYSLLDVACFYLYVHIVPYRIADVKWVRNFLLPRAGRYAHDESHVEDYP